MGATIAAARITTGGQEATGTSRRRGQATTGPEAIDRQLITGPVVIGRQQIDRVEIARRQIDRAAIAHPRIGHRLNLLDPAEETAFPTTGRRTLPVREATVLLAAAEVLAGVPLPQASAVVPAAWVARAEAAHAEEAPVGAGAGDRNY